MKNRLFLGTYKAKTLNSTIAAALECGYRAFDTAFIYAGEKTEKALGCIFNDFFSNLPSNISRSDIFITTKHWRKFHGYELTTNCIQKSLDRLQTDYLDLYLIHWPGPPYKTMNREKKKIEELGASFYFNDGFSEENMPMHRAETWRAMEEAVAGKKIRHIGVSNFTISHLESLKKTAKIWPPYCNQIEVHILNQQHELIEYCQKEGIIVQCYALFGGKDRPAMAKDRVFNNQVVLDISKELNCSNTEVLLRWAMDMDIEICVSSNNPKHIKENFEVFENLQKEKLLDENGGKMSARRHFQMLKGLDERWQMCWVNDPLRKLEFQ